MKLLDKFLFFYSIIFVSILTTGAILSGFAWNKFIITLLFLPVTFYLMYQLLRYFYRVKLTAPAKAKAKPKPTVNQIPPKHLLQQSSPLFLFTIGLFSLTFSATIAKAIITYTSPPLSPLASSINLSGAGL